MIEMKRNKLVKVISSILVGASLIGTATTFIGCSTNTVEKTEVKSKPTWYNNPQLFYNDYRERFKKIIVYMENIQKDGNKVENIDSPYLEQFIENTLNNTGKMKKFKYSEEELSKLEDNDMWSLATYLNLMIEDYEKAIEFLKINELEACAKYAADSQKIMQEYIIPKVKEFKSKYSIEDLE